MRGETLFWIGLSGVASAEMTNDIWVLNEFKGSRGEVSRREGSWERERKRCLLTSPRWSSPESDRGCQPLFLWTRGHSSWGPGRGLEQDAVSLLRVWEAHPGLDQQSRAAQIISPGYFGNGSKPQQRETILAMSTIFLGKQFKEWKIALVIKKNQKNVTEEKYLELGFASKYWMLVYVWQA